MPDALGVRIVRAGLVTMVTGGLKMTVHKRVTQVEAARTMPRVKGNCDGTINGYDVAAYTLALTQPAEYAAQYPGCNRLNGDMNGDGALNGYDTDLFLEYLNGHGGASATRYYCAWDAENRLTYIGPNPQATAADYDAKEEFTYDYLGRRIQAVVSYWDPEQTPAAWTEYSRKRFLWSGWLLLMELDGSNNAVRKYTWGLDLAGQSGQVNSLDDAGGIGGLLAVWDSKDTPGDPGDDLKYAYTYDGNGNVVQVLKWDATSATAAMKARYQYDPYGTGINTMGTYASRNPMRFSTKYWDEWFGLGYWGYRWYSPVLGRWISRDPIGESGDLNVYRSFGNAADIHIDVLGLWGAGVGELRKQIAQAEFELQRLNLTSEELRRRRDVLHALTQKLASTPLGHSDFVGYPEFDWTAEDDDPTTEPWGHPDRHFRHFGEIYPGLLRAVCACDKRAFEGGVHQGQDYYAHYGRGYRWYTGGHIADGDDPDNGTEYRAAWNNANAWTGRMLDKWHKNCVKDADGSWHPKCSDCPCRIRSLVD
jgi:RHS repeat-associated protein